MRIYCRNTDAKQLLRFLLKNKLVIGELLKNLKMFKEVKKLETGWFYQFQVIEFYNFILLMGQ